MKSKEFWKLISELFHDEGLSRVENDEKWKKVELEIKAKNVL